MLSTVKMGFPLQSPRISGFLLERGMRASRISMTTSTRERFSLISRLVFAICPGNHWITLEGISCSFRQKIGLIYHSDAVKGVNADDGLADDPAFVDESDGTAVL